MRVPHPKFQVVQTVTVLYASMMFGDRKRVEQNHTGCSKEDSEIYTEGLGPCIAICIAWRHWAALALLAEISESEREVAAMILKARKQVPDDVIRHLRPFICGGDTEDPSGFDDDPERNRLRVMRGRARILEILHEAGFADPHVYWNRPNETSSLYANLDDGVVIVSADGRDVECWPIMQKV